MKLIPHDPLTDFAVVFIPLFVFLVVKFLGYAFFFKLYLPKDQICKLSLLRCSMGIFSDIIYFGIIYLLFYFGYLPISVGHVGLPTDYIVLPLGLIFPRIFSWWLFTNRLNAESIGEKFGIFLIGFFFSFILDIIAIAAWWFVWIGLTE